MQLTRNSIETAAGPGEWFTGAVYVDTVATPAGPSRLSASSATWGDHVGDEEYAAAPPINP